MITKFKHWIVYQLIGRFYTEKEVKDTLAKMQYDMAQKILGNRPTQSPIVPLEYWQANAKYNTNLFELD